MQLRWWTIALVSTWVLSAHAQTNPVHRITSPDGAIEVQITLQPALSWTVRAYPTGVIGAQPVEILPRSPLGVIRDDHAFVSNLCLLRAERVHRVDEYEMPHGKRRHCRYEYHELRLSVTNPAGRPMDLVCRVSDDAVALRYEFPDRSAEPRKILRELTGWAWPEGSRIWVQPSDRVTQWTPAYERYYLNGAPLSALATNAQGWAFPALLRVEPSHAWALVTEAAVDEGYCGGRLRWDAEASLLRIGWPEADEGNKTDPIEPSSRLPWRTPWRVIVLGWTPGPIVESTVVQDLNPPAKRSLPSWVRPGRVAWSWWSDPESPRHPERMRPFIEWAAQMGWEYFLVDANWNYVPEREILDLCRFARERNVRLLFWYNSGGPHNTVLEAPRDRMMPAEVRRREMAWLKSIGAAGIKVDFFQSDKQSVIGLYHEILRDAAEFQLMVSFHGCTVPRGWSRTYPHLMTMEAVRGEECYIFDATYPAEAPVQNTILPFTRNVVGPMDYTPVTITDQKYPRLTSTAHELALAVLFESGWIHFADRPEGYRCLPPAAVEYLRRVPAAWDEIRWLDGRPGEWVALARRRGETWFLAVIQSGSEPLEVQLRQSFLAPGVEYRWTAVGDGASSREVSEWRGVGRFPELLNIRLGPRGGWVGWCSPKSASR